MKQSLTSGADYSGDGATIGIVSARFNGNFVENMRIAAHSALLENNVSENNITNVYVPGAFELPITCKNMATSGRYSGIIALACVIRGGTPHFDYVCQGCTSGIQQASLETNVPIAFGVLTTDAEWQARVRSAPMDQPTRMPDGSMSMQSPHTNKGRDAALCVLEMINVLKSIKTK